MTLVKTSLTGDGRPLRTKAPVLRDERIRTWASVSGSPSGTAPSSRSVGIPPSSSTGSFSTQKSAKDLTVKVVKGSSRWISGKSKSTAYKIVTPSGTLGIRGTVVESMSARTDCRGADQRRGAVLRRDGCRNLQKRCDVVVANPRRGITDPVKVDRTVLDRLGKSSHCRSCRATRNCPAGSGEAAARRIGQNLPESAAEPQTKAAPAQRQSAPAPEPPEPPTPEPPGPPTPEPPSPPGKSPDGKGHGNEPDGKGHGGVENGKGPENGKGHGGSEPGKSGGNRD